VIFMVRSSGWLSRKATWSHKLACPPIRRNQSFE
jgi:hypothetical protein